MIEIVKNILYRQKLERFLSLYGEYYSYCYCVKLRQNFIKKLNDLTNATDLYKQVFSALEILPEESDIYRCYLKKLKEYFTLNQHILEIGCGFFPSFARLIDIEQNELENGTITCYDKNVIIDSLGNISIYQRNLSRDNLNGYDLIASTLSCDATSISIQKAYEYKKMLFLGICNCLNIDEVYKEAKMYQDAGSVLDIEEIKVERDKNKYPILIKRYKTK